MALTKATCKLRLMSIKQTRPLAKSDALMHPNAYKLHWQAHPQHLEHHAVLQHQGC